MLVLLSVNCCYLAKQGFYVSKYTWSAKKIETVLSDTALPGREKTFLHNVQAIKAYSVEKIGLAANRNYTRYARVEREYLIDVVAASKQDTFSLYEWWFPFFGHAPYLGFFQRTDAVRTARKLKKKGYDVIVSPVDAFSTLGIVSDPVYSFMTKLSLFRLANLIIHEQTHATIFLKNNISFNEELASFVGAEGALRYIRETFGDSSAAYRDALREKHDLDTWDRELRRLYDTLSAVYARGMPRDEKLRLKQEVIRDFKTRMVEDYDSLFATGLFKGVRHAEINNAYLAIRMTYTKNLSLFYRLFKKNGNDLFATVAQLKPLHKKKPKDPRDYVRRLLEQPDTSSRGTGGEERNP
ncbi:MAG: aminopeptidase [Chitinispirillaceae bacterium]|nr:aminopeptidase [Chitinispirillaceae bacterium]